MKSASEWDDDDEDLPLPDGMFPLLDEEPLYTDNTALGITLYWYVMSMCWEGCWFQLKADCSCSIGPRSRTTSDLV